MEVVIAFVLDLEKVDKGTWNEDTSSKFSVKSAYGFLKGDSEGEHLQIFKAFLRVKALPSAYFVA